MTILLAGLCNERAISKLRRLVCVGRRFLTVALLLTILAGCQLTKKPQPVEAPAPVAAPVVVAPIYSSAPIKAAPRTLLKFAQTALKKLGYSIGRIDGIWGPRSAQAVRDFEKDRELWSADGHLSELNLHHLAEESGLTLATFESEKKPEPAGIARKLRGTAALAKGPQLIIVERVYQVFAKPNPYSATLTKLEPGTGIYVVAKQQGWYQIESMNRIKGYIKAD
ncbi:peptidoglycan-binding protein [Arenicella xantha]|uniref:Peptidoglycan hydrolase-like protein with peptidoglycan-binding domain n=1 Tax=Arenicella xantha TaxID=644221 RepID=A0A395JFT6_9GAMM|nr:peptidoglycan-binding protein [Arenicella xantha]RBP48599.1 peptidoglycan hydrolase-like protein with peptidoglycan-binding domain [Arenicella xantha]